MKRLTVIIPDVVKTKLKRRCADGSSTIRDLVVQFIEEGLRKKPVKKEEGE